MGLNVEKAQALLGELHGADPDSEARSLVIPGGPDAGRARLRAVALLSAELCLDPTALVPGVPPAWLDDLCRRGHSGATVLFDGRLSELAGRAVDDVVAQGCLLERLVWWLEGRTAARAEADVVAAGTAQPVDQTAS